MLIRASHRRNSLFSTYSHGNNYVLEVGGGGVQSKSMESLISM